MEEQVNYLPIVNQVSIQTRDTTAGTMMLAQMSEQEFKARLDILKRGRERIAIIQRELMIPGVDYGVIPGTPKPTLLKPGAEKLTDFYQYAADFRSEKTTCSDGTAPTINYTTQCFLHLGDLNGPIIAVGQGSANSWERKHRYRSAERACPECGALKTIIKGKDEYEKDARYKGGWLCYGKKGGCGVKFTATDERITGQQLGEVENPDQWDLDNTLLKMSEKRAYVDGTLRATATSGLFTQDLEDMTDYPVNEIPTETDNYNEQPATTRTTTNGNSSNGQSRGDYGDAATSNQQQAIYKMGRNMFGWTDEEVDRQARAWFKVSLSEMNKKQASDMIVKLQAEKDREKATATPEQPGMM